MEHTYRTQTLVVKGGKLSIKGLPFQAGETVEIIVRRKGKRARGAKYPLRGKPVIYRAPFKGVAIADWEVLR